MNGSYRISLSRSKLFAFKLHLANNHFDFIDRIKVHYKYKPGYFIDYRTHGYSICMYM